MKKYWIAISIALVMTLIVMALSMLSRPDISVTQESIDGAVSVLSTVSLAPVNAELGEDYTYVVLDADAQLYIDGIDEEVSALIVDFEEPLPRHTPYQL